MTDPTQTARIAVVVPCFNDAAFVEEAVRSIREDEPVELVVVDDGSTDPGTAEALARLAEAGVNVVRRENGGLAAARMTGVAATTASYVFPLDADDQLEQGSLAKLADKLDADDDVSFAYGHLEFTGTRVGGRMAQEWDPFALLYANRWGASCLYRRDALVSVGGWSYCGCYEDWDLLMALAEAGHDGAPVDQLVLYYRRHAGTRMNTACHDRHREVYRALRKRHRRLFARRGELARKSQVALWRQLAYPLLLGGRPLYPFKLFYALGELRDRRLRRRAERMSQTRIEERHFGRRSATLGVAKAVVERAEVSIRHRRHGAPAPTTGLRILHYHRVADDQDQLAVPVDEFRRQLELIDELGLEVVDLTQDDIASTVERPTIAFTFDDGYLDVVETAEPLLRERGWPAAVFVVPGAVDGTVRFPWYRPGEHPPLASWDEMRAVEAQGAVRFEPHGLDHRYLPSLDREAAAREIGGSRQRLEAELGRTPRVFCYPGGYFGPRDRELVEEVGFELAVACAPGLNTAALEPFALRRTHIDRYDSLWVFRARLSGSTDRHGLTRRVRARTSS